MKVEGIQKSFLIIFAFSNNTEYFKVTKLSKY
jgi:hypothetical protein